MEVPEVLHELLVPVRVDEVGLLVTSLAKLAKVIEHIVTEHMFVFRRSPVLKRRQKVFPCVEDVIRENSHKCVTHKCRG